MDRDIERIINGIMHKTDQYRKLNDKNYDEGIGGIIYGLDEALFIINKILERKEKSYECDK